MSDEATVKLAADIGAIGDEVPVLQVRARCQMLNRVSAASCPLRPRLLATIAVLCFLVGLHEEGGDDEGVVEAAVVCVEEDVPAVPEAARVHTRPRLHPH